VIGERERRPRLEAEATNEDQTQSLDIKVPPPGARMGGGGGKPYDHPAASGAVGLGRLTMRKLLGQIVRERWLYAVAAAAQARRGVTG
jgi:hypothetical protein